MLGFGVQGHATVVDVTGTRLSKDVLVGVRMRIEVEAVEGPTGKSVSYKLSADLPDGVMGRVLSFFLKRRFRKMQSVALAELSRA